jgi:excisionase family DNA binding protein
VRDFESRARGSSTMSPHSIEKCPYCGEDRDLLTVNEATELASVNRKTIYRWIRTGALEHCVLPSGAIRIFKDSLIRPPGAEPAHAHAEAAAVDTSRHRAVTDIPEKRRPTLKRPHPRTH